MQRDGLISPHGNFDQRKFTKGQEIVKMKSISGDHLFVDRITYNFRRPSRGEIIVFETKNIPDMASDQLGQFYIKRLVALGSERVRIGDDRHLVINGRRLDSSTPHFENVYSFDSEKVPADSSYSGHVNGRFIGEYARYFSDANSEFTVPTDHYMVMGDNTLNSADSRRWGPFPRENVIGKAFFVYWPIGAQEFRASRFGLGNR